MTNDDVTVKNTAWWATHPGFAEKYSKMRYDVDSLARSTVHWHHNVESRRRHQGWGASENDEFLLRQYAIAATQAWLLEAEAKCKTLGPSDWYQYRDLQVLIRNLQVALDDFEWNTQNPMCKP
jgi:hypothetical protein